MKTIQVFYPILFLLAFISLTPTLQASQKWTFKGKIMVNHLLPELKEAYGNSEPVVGITVRVHARSRVLGVWGTWNSWGTATTKSDGSFSFSEDHNDDRRQFKVEILFDSDELRIKEGQETGISFDTNGFPIDLDFDLTDKDWHEVHNDNGDGPEDGRKAGLIDLGNIFITRTVVRKHADIWKLATEIFDLWESYGSDYTLKKKQVIKYPMGIGNNANGTASYSNPLNGTVYIKEDEFFTSTIAHELFHQWQYDHATGENGMAWQLIKHQDTHQLRENTTFVPFFEAGATWASAQILREITDGKLRNYLEAQDFDKPYLPLNRAYVGAALGADERFLANVDYTERGWHTLFNILTHNALGKCDFNLPSSDKYALQVFDINCPDAKLAYSLKDVLSIFMKHPAQGYPGYLDTEEMNFMQFLNRAKAVLTGLDDEKVKQIKNYLNPNQADNPKDFYCTFSGPPEVIGQEPLPIDRNQINTVKMKKKN